MSLQNLLRGTLLVVLIAIKVRGEGCASREIYGHKEINMCEQRSWIMGRAAISMTTNNMGSNTGCICVIRSKTSGMATTTSLQSRGTDPYVNKCNESLIQMNPFSQFFAAGIQNFTCASPFESISHTGNTTDDVTITLTRPDTSVEVSFCILVLPDRWQADDLTLSCQSGLTPPSPPATVSTNSSTTPATTIAASSNVHTSPIPSTSSLTTTAPSTIPPSTTTSSSTLPSTIFSPTTPPPTSEPSTTPAPVSSLSPTSSSTASEMTSASGRESVSTAGSSPTADGYKATETPNPEVAAIAGGVSGAVVLIIIVIIVIVVACRRQRSQQKPLIEEQPKVDNQGYFNPGLEDDLHNPHHSFTDVLTMATDRPDSMAPSAKDAASSPETRSLDGLLAASSNTHAMEDDPPRDNGAVNIDATAGSAMMRVDADEAQPPTPGGDLYAVVNKPKQRDPPKSRPEKPPKPASLSTSSNGADITTPAGGDVYAVVDKSRNKGGNAEKSSLPSAEATLPSPPSPPADSSPSLVYADLEELKGEGRRSSPPRPPPKKAQETEYAVIDHIATVNLAKEA